MDSNTVAGKSQSNKRIRQFHEKHKGPYEVLVRKLNEEIKPIQMCDYINKKYY